MNFITLNQAIFVVVHSNMFGARAVIKGIHVGVI